MVFLWTLSPFRDSATSAQERVALPERAPCRAAAAEPIGGGVDLARGERHAVTGATLLGTSATLLVTKRLLETSAPLLVTIRIQVRLNY